MDKPVQIQHGAHTIKAGMLHGEAVARAFVTGGRQGMVAQATGDTLDAAIDLLKADLDASIEAEQSHRRHDATLGFEVPTEAEYLRALQVVKPHGGHWKMLRAHALAGESGLSTVQLAYDAGYQNYSAANLQYGLMGKEMAETLGIDLPKSTVRKDTDVATGVLATAGPPRNGDFVWVMHPELRAAVLSHEA